MVLLVDDGDRGSMGLLLNRRTGMLMGDLGDDFKAFMIQVGGMHSEGARRSFFIRRVASFIEFRLFVFRPPAFCFVL